MNEIENLENKTGTEHQYKVAGMSCTACALNIERTLNNIDGVQNVTVNFADKSAKIKFNEDKIDFKFLQKKIKEIGYKLLEKNSQEDELAYLKKERIRLIIAWIITIPLTIKMIGEMFFGYYLGGENTAFYLDLVLTFPVIFIIGFPVILSTIRSIIKFTFNMDSLIGIGTMAAYSTGILKLIGLNISSFVVVGAMITAINFIGNYLKNLATGKASKAIKQLLELGAKSAHLVKNNKNIIDVPVEELKINDIVLVKPGEKIPIDGIIIEGATSIDESIATGESIPVDKKTGDKVIGATINQYGVIKIKTQKIGKDTFLSQIIKMVEEAQGTKVPIQAFADKVTGYFVPIILLISVLTFLGWIIFPGKGLIIASYFQKYLPWINLNASNISLAIFASVATLVIACPCALGLATPTAIMVGMGKGAVNGILIRNGEAIQTSKNLTTIVFDKTGTITRGKPAVTAYETNISEKEFFKLIYSVESLSEHPLAKAILKKLQNKKIEKYNIKKFKAESGKGISAEVKNKKVIVGSIKYFNDLNISFENYNDKIERYLERGLTIILSAVNNKTIGIIGISDEIKNDSKSAIASLKKMNLKTIMLTGDNKKSAGAIANDVGIDEVYAELLPENKINIIKRLQKENEIVAMVGDGINDAPALKQANVGIAIGTGTDIAIESADITLVSGSLTGVVKSIKLSKATFKKILENLFWAFFYNIIAIPVAIVGLLHPVIAESAMALSSINVVGNSLRLKKLNLDKEKQNKKK